MGRAFTFLPYVDSCCDCLNLKTGSYYIAIYVVILSFFDVMRLVVPECHNMRATSGFGLAIYILEFILCGFAVLLIISSIVVVFSISINKPIVKPFIILVYLEEILVIVLTFCYIIRMQTLKFLCKQMYLNKDKTFYLHPFWMSLQCLLHVCVAAILIYYTIVVNSYAKLWDEHGGNIPEPEPAYYQIVQVPPPPPGSPLGSPPGTPYYGPPPPGTIFQGPPPPGGVYPRMQPGSPYMGQRQPGAPNAGQQQQGPPNLDQQQPDTPNTGQPGSPKLSKSNLRSPASQPQLNASKTVHLPPESKQRAQSERDLTRPSQQQNKSPNPGQQQESPNQNQPPPESPKSDQPKQDPPNPGKPQPGQPLG